METQLSWTPFVAQFFSDKNNQRKLLDFLQTKLPVYVAQHSAKIKPVRGTDHLYELKVRIGKDFYRLAYRYEKQQIQALYLTKTLQKVCFDREVQLFLKKEKP